MLRMKIYLDDARLTPSGWVGVLWPEEAIRFLELGQVAEISLDHDLGDDGRGIPPVPIVFETMVFSDIEGADDDLGCWRTATLGEAKRKHYEIVEKLRNIDPPILLEVAAR